STSQGRGLLDGYAATPRSGSGPASSAAAPAPRRADDRPRPRGDARHAPSHPPSRGRRDHDPAVQPRHGRGGRNVRRRDDHAGRLRVLAPFLFAIALRIQTAVPADTLFGIWVHASGFAVPLVALGFVTSWAFPVLISLVAGDIFASEDRYGTWKTVLTRSCTRRDVFAGKVLAAATWSVLVVVLLAVSGLVAGLLLIGSQPLVRLS